MPDLHGGAPDPTLVALFRDVRADPRRDPKPTAMAHMAGIDLSCDGAGQPLVAGMGGSIEVPFGCRIMGARLLADVPCTVKVVVKYGTFEDYPNAAPLYDVIPTLTAAASADLNVTNWIRRLIARDVLQYQLITTDGIATKLTLALWVRKTDGQFARNVTDSGNTLVDANGNTIALRN